jgi:hypothetical protein
MTHMCQNDATEAVSDENERSFTQLHLDLSTSSKGIAITYTLSVPNILDPFKELPSIVRDSINSTT